MLALTSRTLLQTLKGVAEKEQVQFL